MIKHLVENHGDSVLVDIYREIRNKKPSVEAIINSVTDPINEWWPGFFKKYVAGEIYGVGSDVFLKDENITDTFNINTKSDTLEIFEGNYPDLSAKIYRINLNYANIDSSAQIKFAVDSDDATVMVFKLKGGSLQYLDDSPKLTVPNVRGLTDQGYDLVAVVVNSDYHAPDYTQESDIDLEVKVIKGTDLSQLTYADIRINHIRVYYDYADTIECGHPAMAGWATSHWFYNGRQGSFTNNTFTASWKDTTSGIWGNREISGTASITLDDTLGSASFTLTETIRDFDSECTSELTMTRTGIPFTEPEYKLAYMLTGTETCDHLTIEWKQTCPDTDCDIIIVHYECNAGSAIRIDLR